MSYSRLLDVTTEELRAARELVLTKDIPMCYAIAEVRLGTQYKGTKYPEHREAYPDRFSDWGFNIAGEAFWGRYRVNRIVIMGLLIRRRYKEAAAYIQAINRNRSDIA